MRLNYSHIFCLALAAVCGGQCNSLERDNPLDPVAGEEATLSLYLPLPKSLAIVVNRIVATLEGPDIRPIVKELSFTPLGPATGTIGALPPSSGLTLTLEGYDLVDELLFRGEQNNITITAGDTTRVEMVLNLVKTIPVNEEEPPAQEEVPDDGTSDDGTSGEGDSGGTEGT